MSRYYNYGSLAEQSPDRRKKSPTKSYIEYTGRAKKRQPGTRIQLNTKLRLRCMLMVALVAVMGMFITFRNGAAASQGYELVKMKQTVASLERENARLRLDIAGLKSPERIKNIAADKLGMVLPPKIYFANQNR